ncbi:MAG TPA: AraC family transcriptional regulator ligand-binding domain-containing protein [Aquabacterium sp.]|uniref:AraC family transcriptional regulator n=1 Tax=Aquabacterium sp. TaxID=1872578 RepID=UPI002E366E2D|nr:AraC family transcriptional regulator ligand-binding domain-containing protein [Aquabacterium sp.]HEX5356510.1 AraC family transcriptional regulator ligand-binding domain-containing protein [Aquabacterium sp.]
MTALLRAAALTHFEQVASECGLDARQLVAEVGLPERCLREPDLTISALQTCTLLELAAERAREPAFGLRMAATRRLSNLGPLGLLLRDQPTLRHALEELVAHIHLHNEAFSLSLVQDGDWVCLREETVLEGGQSVRQAVEMAMGTTFRLLRIFLGDSWQPRHVSFRHAAPTNTGWHRKVFGGSVVFGREFNDIICNARDLQAPNPGADPVMARYSLRLLEAEHGQHTSMTDRVRRLVVLLLPRGHCRADVIAQHLGVDRRTVTNRLNAEGTGFKALVDAMRCDLLASYMQDGSRPLSDVASLLGFSELSAFSRWHRQQFGTTASHRSRQR